MTSIRSVPAALILAAVVLRVAGCDGSPTAHGDDRVVGRWEWVRATGGIAGTERTPETEGVGRQLRFEPDGSVELWRDGDLQVRTSYRIRPSTGNAPSAFDHDRIVYGRPLFGWDWQHLIRVDARGLALRDPCCDGFEWEFRPVR